MAPPGKTIKTCSLEDEDDDAPAFMRTQPNEAAQSPPTMTRTAAPSGPVAAFAVGRTMVQSSATASAPPLGDAGILRTTGQAQGSMNDADDGTAPAQAMSGSIDQASDTAAPMMASQVTDLPDTLAVTQSSAGGSGGFGGTAGRAGADRSKSYRAVRAKSLCEDGFNETGGESPIRMPMPIRSDPSRDLALEVEALRLQKLDLQRENNELRAKLRGADAPCPSRLSCQLASAEERAKCARAFQALRGDETAGRRCDALAIELGEAMGVLTLGAGSSQDTAFRALPADELVKNAEAVRPRFTWLLDQFQGCLAESGFAVAVEQANLQPEVPTHPDAARFGDLLCATFRMQASSLEQVYLAALVLSRAPPMMRRGTRWVGFADRFQNAVENGYGDIRFSFAVDGHVCELALVPDCFRGIGEEEWASRSSAAQSLLASTIEKRAAACQTLLRAGTDTGAARDMHGLSAMHYAALNADIPMIELLVRNGADVFAADNEGCVPLHRALLRRHLEVAEKLLDIMASKDAPSDVGPVVKRKFAELWQWALEIGGSGQAEGLGTVPWSLVIKLIEVARKIGADTDGGRNAADYAAELGDPVFLHNVMSQLQIEPQAYATDSGISTGIRDGRRGLLLTVPVRRINWSGSRPMGREGSLCDFAEYLRHNETLEELIMWECGLEERAAVGLFSALASNASVSRIDVMRNAGAGAESALAALGSSLRSNTVLQELVLWACDVTPSGAAALFAGLADSGSLRKLNLRENRNLGNPGAMKALGDCLAQNASLEELDLWECSITAEGAIPLFAGLAKNRTLKRLALVGNRGCGSASALEALAECLKENKTLEAVLLAGCGYRPGYVDDVRVAL